MSSSVNNESNLLPIYILPPLCTTSTFAIDSSPMEISSSLRIDTSDNIQKWDTLIHQMSDLSSPSLYTSKIRHRHYSVGSYYEHKSTTVALHTNHTLYLLGSAPVSPLSRTSTASNESYYQHSPISYENISLNALRRVNPFLDVNLQSSSITNYDRSRTIDQCISSSCHHRDEHQRSMTAKVVSPTTTTLKSIERVIMPVDDC
jgi:hypothetical protein